MLRMKQTARIISTYAADVSGVCSALFELGGMTVMHDASGCNSTYNTHDEPRWYDMDSMVYISALTEMQAIMGDDEKLINDIVEMACETNPAFTAIAGTPIPMMTGCDIPAIASVVENMTGIPSFGFQTNGMHSYQMGVSAALTAYAERMIDDAATRDEKPAVNIIGVTPLDFSVNGMVDSMRTLLTDAGFKVIGTWAMGSTREELARAGGAWANLVVSYAGLAAAEVLKRKFGTPYVIATPFGMEFSETVMKALHRAIENNEDIVPFAARPADASAEIAIIGESVTSGSLAAALTAKSGKPVRVVCPLETGHELLAPGDLAVKEEDEIAEAVKQAKVIIADPLFRPICPPDCDFRALPHEAFSGRIYRKDIPSSVLNISYFH